MMQVWILQVNITNDKKEDAIDINIVAVDKGNEIDTIIEKYRFGEKCFLDERY